jgi:hypothetical protein
MEEDEIAEWGWRRHACEMLETLKGRRDHSEDLDTVGR